jgi:hypothetical protein
MGENQLVTYMIYFNGSYTVCLQTCITSSCNLFSHMPTMPFKANSWYNFLKVYPKTFKIIAKDSVVTV